MTAVVVDESLLDETGKFHLNDAGLVAYSHGEYFEPWRKDRQVRLQCEEEKIGIKRAGTDRKSVPAL